MVLYIIEFYLVIIEKLFHFVRNSQFKAVMNISCYAHLEKGLSRDTLGEGVGWGVNTSRCLGGLLSF